MFKYLSKHEKAILLLIASMFGACVYVGAKIIEVPTATGGVMLLGGGTPTGATTTTPTIYNDPFSSTENPLVTNWTTANGWGAMISNGSSVTAISGQSAAYWDTVTLNADQWSEVQYGSVTNLAGCDGPGVRLSISPASYLGYVAAACAVDGIEVTRKDAGGFDLISLVNPTQGTGASGDLAVGDKVKLAVSGVGATVTLKLYVNGVQEGADLTDTTADRILSGGAGIYSGAFVYNMTEWWGGNL